MEYNDGSKELTLAAAEGDFEYPKEYLIRYYREDGSCTEREMHYGGAETKAALA